jgi:hypothetical protein
VKCRRVSYSDREREGERGLHKDNDLGKSLVAAGEKSKMTQKRKLKRLVYQVNIILTSTGRISSDVYFLLFNPNFKTSI